MSPPRAPSISTGKTTGNFLRKNYGEELAWSRSGLIFFPGTWRPTCDLVQRNAEKRFPTRRFNDCSNESDFPGSPRRTCRCFRGENSNEFLWRELWPTAPRCSSSTSRRQRSTSNRNWESKIWSTSLVRDHGLTCVLVTHDRDQARRVCPRVIVLEAGRLVRSGTAMEVLGA